MAQAARKIAKAKKLKNGAKAAQATRKGKQPWAILPREKQDNQINILALIRDINNETYLANKKIDIAIQNTEFANDLTNKINNAINTKPQFAVIQHLEYEQGRAKNAKNYALSAEEYAEIAKDMANKAAEKGNITFISDKRVDEAVKRARATETLAQKAASKAQEAANRAEKAWTKAGDEIRIEKTRTRNRIIIPDRSSLEKNATNKAAIAADEAIAAANEAIAAANEAIENANKAIENPEHYASLATSAADLARSTSHTAERISQNPNLTDEQRSKLIQASNDANEAAERASAVAKKVGGKLRKLRSTAASRKRSPDKKSSRKPRTKQ